jgi:hypothetical protein
MPVPGANDGSHQKGNEETDECNDSGNANRHAHRSSTSDQSQSHHEVRVNTKMAGLALTERKEVKTASNGQQSKERDNE